MICCCQNTKLYKLITAEDGRFVILLQHVVKILKKIYQIDTLMQKMYQRFQ